MSRHFASFRFFCFSFAPDCDFSRFFEILALKTEGLGGHFSINLGCQTKKSILRKCVFYLEKIDIFKVSVQIVAKFNEKKSIRKATWNKDAKKCEKIAFGSHFGAPGNVLDGPGASGAARERPKSGPRRPQELGAVASRALCDALGRSWALFCFLLRLSLNFGQFFVDFCYEKVLEVGFS